MTPPVRPLLIRAAELEDGRIADVRIEGGIISAIGTGLAAEGADTIAAGGARLLPGLHDHHIHIASTAAARASVLCGPPAVEDEAALADALSVPGTGWLRGIGYHESVAGMLDRHRLDELVADRPVRIQHRTGRMWFFNSAGLNALLSSGLPAPDGLDTDGRLFDEDGWMRRALAGSPPDFAPVGLALARSGITGITDMSPGNGGAEAALFGACRSGGTLPQRVVMAGTLALGECAPDHNIRVGPFKLHLHEGQFPDWDETVSTLREAHDQGRGAAVHCVTEAELVFALAVLDEAGAMAGDRIEHASVVPDGLADRMAEMGIAVVVQPHFVAERGDAYLRDIPAKEWPTLYRLASLAASGLTLAGGSDAPFGDPDPWAAMAAAVHRTTRSGIAFGLEEALSPEAALSLWLADPEDLTCTRQVKSGGVADLCLLNQPWAQARGALSAGLVRLTLLGGQIVHDGINQAPVERH